MRTNSYLTHERSHLDAHNYRAMAADTRSLQLGCLMSTEARLLQPVCLMSTEARLLQPGCLMSTETRPVLQGPTTHWPGLTQCRASTASVAACTAFVVVTL